MIDNDLIVLFAWFGEALAFAALLAFGIWTLGQRGNLPERLPQHFGITGEPDAWGGEWVVWLLLGIQTSTFALLTLLGGTFKLIAGAPIARPSGMLMVLYIKLMTTILMFFITWSIVRVGRGQAKRLNMIVVFGLIGLMTVGVLLPKLLS